MSKETITIEHLKTQLQSIKTAFESPRIHLVEYLEALTLRADISCIELGNDETEIQARIDQSSIVDEIKKFEAECLDQLPTDEFEKGFSVEMLGKIKECECEVEKAGGLDQSGLRVVVRKMDKAFLYLQTRIFLNKTLVFWDEADISNYILL